jgi:hypothetical protein
MEHVMDESLPGTPRHQALLRAVVGYYAGDPRIRAVAVFGSLGRGNSDQYSDLDLDVVIGDGVAIDVLAEVSALCAPFAAIGERAALIVPDGAEAADVVLASLMELSIRYHPLATTSPNIVDSLLVLAGPLDTAAIVSAGVERPQPASPPLVEMLERCLRYAVGVDVALQRRQLWAAIESLHRMRALAMALFAASRGGVRPYQLFQAEAGAALDAALGATLPQHSLASARAALIHFLDLLEHDLPALTDGRLQLTEAQRAVLAQIRARATQP